MCVLCCVCCVCVCKSCGAVVLVVRHCVRIHFFSVVFLVLPSLLFNFCFLSLSLFPLPYHPHRVSPSQHIVVCLVCTASKKGSILPRSLISQLIPAAPLPTHPPWSPQSFDRSASPSLSLSLSLSITLISHFDNIVIGIVWGLLLYGSGPIYQIFVHTERWIHLRLPSLKCSQDLSNIL